MNRDKVTDFLIKAKKSTYAGKGPQVTSSRPQSHDLKYSEGDLLYIDTYLGGENFSGEEAVWNSDIPIWSMNYCGRVLAADFEGNFLKEALLFVPWDKPFRGPETFTRGNLLYKCSVTGDFEWFSGFEEILYKNTRVYECVFHGGIIK